MKAFVTGASGFIGGHLVARLLADADEVTALARPSTDTHLLRTLGARIAIGDVREEDGLRAAVERADVVYHLAAARAGKAIGARELDAVNVGGADRILRAASEAGVDRVVFCSTGGVHGDSPAPFSEDAPLKPNSPYRRSRAAAEAAARAWAQRGLPLVIARLTGVYGPRDRQWLPLFREAARGRMVLPGSGRHTVHLSYVDDVVDGLVACARVEAAAGRTYLIGTDRPASVWDFAAAIAGEAGAPIRRRPWMDLPLAIVARVSSKAFHPRGDPPRALSKAEFFALPRVYDVTRAKRELGLRSGTPLREGVRRTLAWYRSRGDV